MPPITVNGLNISVDVDDFGVDYSDLNSYNRNESMRLEGITRRELRSWSFTVPDVAVSQTTLFTVESLRDWIKGRGHYFTGERLDPSGATTRFSKFDSSGGIGFDFNLTNSSSARFGTWAIQVNSSLSTNTTASFGSEGRYSVSVWRWNTTASTYALCTVVADGVTSTSYVGTQATSAFFWWGITAASGFLSVTLRGSNDGGGGATSTYDGLMILPYALTTAQIAARAARTAAEPNFPFVELGGDLLEDRNAAIVVKGDVESEATDVINDGGRTMLRTLKVSFVEK